MSKRSSSRTSRTSWPADLAMALRRPVRETTLPDPSYHSVMPNQITTLRPYRWNGMWVFDDDRVGLHREPFVGGADDIIDAAIAEKGIANADAGFLLLFSADPFPGADLEFTWVR